MEKKAFILGVIAIAAAGCAKNEINIIHHDGYTIVSQTRGPELGYNEDQQGAASVECCVVKI